LRQYRYVVKNYIILDAEENIVFSLSLKNHNKGLSSAVPYIIRVTQLTSLPSNMIIEFDEELKNLLDYALT